MPTYPTIAVTAGDPCGIGPEVLLKALGAFRRSSARLVVIGDLEVFSRTAKRLRLGLPSWHVVPAGQRLASAKSPFVFLDCGHRSAFRPGRTSRAAGAASLAYLERAVALWRAGQIQAVVTGPVTKWAMGRVQPSFIGQTEYLARAMRCRDVVMLFVSDRLRIALLTRHLPLSRVPRALTAHLLETTLRLTVEGLTRYFRIPHPRLALCGLNPHAGEAARCGREEQAVMVPVLRALAREGIVCHGPFAADGFFRNFASRSFSAGVFSYDKFSEGKFMGYDAVVCSYHDQGLIPFKMAARDRGCQLSLGLPIIRTSPDHGSGLDIAGKGMAHPGSMIYALRLAATLAQRKKCQTLRKRGKCLTLFGDADSG